MTEWALDCVVVAAQVAAPIGTASIAGLMPVFDKFLEYPQLLQNPVHLWRDTFTDMKLAGPRRIDQHNVLKASIQQ